MRRADWQQQCKSHSAAAEALIGSVCFSSAYYLAGLAVECALKAKIAKSSKASTWPKKEFIRDIHTHSLAQLVKQAGLEASLKAKCANATFNLYWQTVSGWQNDSKYETWSAAEARDMVRAAAGRFGVLAWIKNAW